MFVTSPGFLQLFFLWLIDENLPIFITGKYYVFSDGMFELHTVPLLCLSPTRQPKSSPSLL